MIWHLLNCSASFFHSSPCSPEGSNHTEPFAVDWIYILVCFQNPRCLYICICSAFYWRYLPSHFPFKSKPGTPYFSVPWHLVHISITMYFKLPFAFCQQLEGQDYILYPLHQAYSWFWTKIYWMAKWIKFRIKIRSRERNANCWQKKW